MVHRGYFRAMLVGLALAAGADVLQAVGMEGPRMVLRRGVAALPAELAPFFEARSADLEERVTEPAGAWGRDEKLRGRKSWDHLWLDVKAKDPSLSARLEAAEGFPRRESQARELFKSLGLEQQGGKLPWAVEDLFDDLARAFQQKGEDAIVKTAAYLTYFAWAASQPFNATMNHNGRDTGNLYLGELAMGEPNCPHQSVHYRVMGELVRRNRSRYLERMQVRPIELQPVTAPAEACFRQMLSSLARLDDLLTTDRELTERLGLKDGVSLVARADEYYELLDGRCGDVVVERLRSGAMLAANLITGAWEKAGGSLLSNVDARKPPATTLPSAVPGEAARPAPGPLPPIGTMRYVGSKGSPVFHRTECAHVKRISPTNLVTYASVEDALQQGKRPCRVCKPDQEHTQP